MADRTRSALCLWRYARDEFVSKDCVPRKDREPGCLSCDTLHFFEVLANALEGEGDDTLKRVMEEDHG